MVVSKRRATDVAGAVGRRGNQTTAGRRRSIAESSLRTEGGRSKDVVIGSSGRNVACRMTYGADRRLPVEAERREERDRPTDRSIDDGNDGPVPIARAAERGTGASVARQ